MGADSTSTRPGQDSLWPEILLLTIAASAPLFIQWWSGLTRTAEDLCTFFMPNLAWWWRSPRWLGGWNASVFAGYPGNADPEGSQLHPFGVLFAIFPPITASTIEGGLDPALAAIGMLLYLRQVGCGRGARLVGALSFGLGGFVAAHAIHLSILRGALAVPWALFAIEALEGGALVAGLGLATAFILLSGHPQVMAYALLLVAAYALWPGRPLERKRWLALGLGIALGAGVAAAAWLPALELISRSTRSGVTLAHRETLHLEVKDLASLFVPFLYAPAAAPPYGDPHRYMFSDWLAELTGYPGMLAWIAMLAGLPGALRDARGRFWLACALAALLLAAGPGDALLPLAGVRGPIRLLLWWSVAAAALSGMAMRSALQAARSEPGLNGLRGRRWWLASGVVATVLVASSFGGRAAQAAAIGSAAALALTLLGLGVAARVSEPAASAVLVLVLAADLIAFNASLPSGGDFDLAHDTGVLRTLREVREKLPAPDDRFARVAVVSTIPFVNWAPLVGVQAIQGYHSLVLQSLASLLNPGLSHMANPLSEKGILLDPTLAEASSHVLDLLRCRLVAVTVGPPGALAKQLARESARGPNAADSRWEGLDSVNDGAHVFYLNRRARPVAWLVGRVRVVPADQALSMIRGPRRKGRKLGLRGGIRRPRADSRPLPDFDPAAEALSVTPIPGIPASAAAPEPADASSQPVTVLAYDDDEIRLVAESATAALLVTSELDYPGWTARLDGAEAPVYSVNAGFRSVVFPAGRHEVTFRYRPRSGIAGLAIGAASLVLLAAIGRRWRPGPQ